MTPSLSSYRDARLGLEELVALAGKAIDLRATPQPDGRVEALPDSRAVRFYQSGGLLDAPLAYEGRRAVYGYRHLLQLLAVKLLQTQGLSLAQVQRALTGADLARLEAAVLPAFASGDDAEVAAGSAPVATPPPAPAASPAATAALVPSPDPLPLLAVQLAPGLILTLDPALIRDPRQTVARLRAALNGAEPVAVPAGDPSL